MRNEQPHHLSIDDHLVECICLTVLVVHTVAAKPYRGQLLPLSADVSRCQSTPISAVHEFNGGKSEWQRRPVLVPYSTRQSAKQHCNHSKPGSAVYFAERPYL